MLFSVLSIYQISLYYLAITKKQPQEIDVHFDENVLIKPISQGLQIWYSIWCHVYHSSTIEKEMHAWYKMVIWYNNIRVIFSETSIKNILTQKLNIWWAFKWTKINIQDIRNICWQKIHGTLWCQAQVLGISDERVHKKKNNDLFQGQIYIGKLRLSQKIHQKSSIMVI